jgi:signal transduction histidine kinase/ActR/RegA family two-component response regulator
MTPFRDLSIRRKLLLLTLTSTTVALALASSGFLGWDIVQFRSEARRDMAAQSAIIAENSGAPLTFGDDRVAGEILGTLRVQPRVELACLYQRGGALLTSYQRERDSACPLHPPDASSYGWSAFHVITPVTIGRDPAGTLYIRRELDDMYARLPVAGATVLGLLLLAFSAAFLTSARIQRSIASPLLELAGTARAISSTRNYSLRAAPASNDEIGDVMRAFNEMLDRIAEALERERQVGRLKDEFLATLSHELRTPLTAMLGWTRMLRSSRLDAEGQSKALEIIERNARAQATLVEDLLDMSRIASGRPRLQVREADLAAIVDAAVEVIQPAATAKNLRFNVDIGARPALTYGDPDRLQQVVWNLLSNAVKFTPPEGQVWVRLERDRGYQLSVRDTGAGIERKFLPLVFEPFRQADATSSREYGGLGLGLAIVKQLVELHGGTIEAHSPGRDKGARFEVRLPSVVLPSGETAARIPSSAEPLPPPLIDGSLLRGLRVLVVDDEDDARMLLETTLRQYGAQVATAASAAEALAEIDRRPPDVLLSDISMPNEDGLSLIRQVRARVPSKGGTIPAVAISACASVSDGRSAEAAGFQAHLAKPFEPSELATLTALLTRRRHTTDQTVSGQFG